jgi:hypothetical protein
MSCNCSLKCQPLIHPRSEILTSFSVTILVLGVGIGMGIKFRAFTLSHSTSPIFMMDSFEIGSLELLA